MPAPLWEDAKNWLAQQGVDLNRPDAHVILNDTMNKMAQGLVTRPSYGGNYGAPIGGDILSPQMQSSIQTTPLPGDTGSLRAPTPPIPEFDDRAAVNALAAPKKSRSYNPPGKAGATRIASPTSKPPMGAPGSEPDVPGGAPPNPGQAVAGQPTSIPGSGSDDGMGLIGKALTGLGLAGGVGGAAMLARGRASPAGMRPRTAPGLGIGGGLPGTPPGGGPGSGFGGAMGTPVPGGMPPSPGASPLTGTLPLGAPAPGALVPSATMPMPPPAMPMTGVVPSGPAMSVPPDVMAPPPPDIAALLSAPRPQGPVGGGRIRSPRPRTPPTPKNKPTLRTSKKKSSQ